MPANAVSVLNVAFYLMGTIQLMAGTLGVLFLPDTLAEEERNTGAQLLATHLTQIRQTTTFFQGLAFLSFSNESLKVKAKLLALSSMTAMVCSVKELTLDDDRGIFQQQPCWFFLQCLDNGAMLGISTLCFTVAVVVPFFVDDAEWQGTGRTSLKMD